MREIKFRGYDKNSEVWRYGSYFCKKDTMLSPVIYTNEESYKKLKKSNEYHLIIWNEFSDWGFPISQYQSEVDEKSIGQYTGLKDVNGKEIYEGDICRVSCKYFNIKNELSIVIFKDGCFCFQYRFSDDYVKIYGAWDVNTIEIIGNVYENPELLHEND